MVKDAMPKRVPCPINRPDDPSSFGRVSLRHRQILIEWLLEVASEEKFRRYFKVVKALTFCKASKTLN